jgi:excinuclease ABC subunit C
VQTLHEQQQKMANVEFGDRDVFGAKLGPAGAVIQVFLVRRGRVVERLELVAEREGAVPISDTEVVQAAVSQFYEARPVPPEFDLPVDIDEREATEEWLSARAGRRVRLRVPRRGEKRELVDLANRNAALAYQTRFSQGPAANQEALETLRLMLSLPSAPRRIECFDISTIQGAETVASLVVCEDGRMRRGEYRKFRVRPDPDGKETGSGIRDAGPGRAEPAMSLEPQASRFLDDFAAMRQVVQRRYRRALEAGGPFPDLIVIDGGKGQLTAAYEALESLGLANLVAIGLAKREELIFTRDASEPLRLAPHDPALLLLQQIRDEAHRFAVTFHRKARSLRDLRSALDGVPGVGPRRRRALLTRFGSLAGVRRATREELVALVGPKVADAVLAYFSRNT